MSMTLAPAQSGAALTAGSFGSIRVSVAQPADAAATAVAAAGTGATIASGSPGEAAAIGNGLNFAGLAAVASAIGTYLAGLSAAKKTQMIAASPVVGPPSVHLGPGGFSCPVHSADVVTFTATLAAILNSAGNYGPAGS